MRALLRDSSSPSPSIEEASSQTHGGNAEGRPVVGGGGPDGAGKDDGEAGRRGGGARRRGGGERGGAAALPELGVAAAAPLLGFRRCFAAVARERVPRFARVPIGGTTDWGVFFFCQKFRGDDRPCWTPRWLRQL